MRQVSSLPTWRLFGSFGSDGGAGVGTDALFRLDVTGWQGVWVLQRSFSNFDHLATELEDFGIVVPAEFPKCRRREMFGIGLNATLEQERTVLLSEWLSAATCAVMAENAWEAALLLGSFLGASAGSSQNEVLELQDSTSKTAGYPEAVTPLAVGA